MEKKQKAIKEDFDIIPVLQTLDKLGLRVQKYDQGSYNEAGPYLVGKVVYTITVTKK